MLPAEHRLRASADFAHVIKAGRRAGRATLVIHLAERPAATGSSSSSSSRPSVSRVGLVVGKSVGNSVLRHRVSRRLRAQLGERLDRIPSDVDVVVRAQPAAAGASSARLGADVDSALARVLRRESGR